MAVRMGDFNAILRSEERKGGVVGRVGISKGFGLVDSCALLDIGFHGPPFTWCRGKLQQRLDRCLINSCWLSTYLDSSIIHLDRLGSDHRPVLFRMTCSRTNLSQKPFTWCRGNLQQRLDRCLVNSCWLSAYPDSSIFHLDRLGSDHRPVLFRMTCARTNLSKGFAGSDHSVLQDCWSSNLDFRANISNLREKLANWNSNSFGTIGARKKRLLARQRGIDRALGRRHSDFLLELEKKLKAELKQVLEREESLYMRKS
ncbi:hypothetical protein F3Y22_tig00013960pilonHSYRG00081 [Hibiscus syriacus]|uniref:Uncharacterized protein n=1 Tax=Hibiscus syriacus TaxID=106335 RepID=A0A6A3C0H8_HIBSY|nr:hypothetical protein F3Y22_tig00013960pilonHSYRG00081 [Hibiscus syriacus]